MGSDKVEQALYWPETMLQEILDHATRTDRSLSYIVQIAWKRAAQQISAADRDTLAAAIRPYGGAGGVDKRKQTLYFPATMLAEIEAQSARLDSSLSFVMQAAVAMSMPAIAALPDVGDYVPD